MKICISPWVATNQPLAHHLRTTLYSEPIMPHPCTLNPTLPHICTLTPIMPHPCNLDPIMPHLCVVDGEVVQQPAREILGVGTQQLLVKHQQLIRLLLLLQCRG